MSIVGSRTQTESGWPQVPKLSAHTRRKALSIDFDARSLHADQERNIAVQKDELAKDKAILDGVASHATDKSSTRKIYQIISGYKYKLIEFSRYLNYLVIIVLTLNPSIEKSKKAHQVPDR